jgi:U3 small nucleolar RNA-associated protein 21
MIMCREVLPISFYTTSLLQTSGHETYAAVGTSIVVYDRARPVRTYSAHEDPIVGLLSVGTTLISYDTGNHIKIHDTKERALVGEITLLENTQSGVGAGGGRISALVHPATYVNKFVIGFSNGQLELWNFNTRKLLYTFKSHKAHLSADGGASYGSDSDDERTPVSSSAGSRDASAGSRANAQAVTCLEQSPACDVVGVGFSSGKILLLHLKLDQVLFSFSQKLAGGVGGGVAVTSLSFRTDAGAEKSPFLASSTADGRIHVWNLGSKRPGAGRSDEDGKETSNRLERKLQSSIEDAHRGPISRVAFIPGEPILVSAGAEDNSLKVWIFDAPDGSARLLRSREAHRGPPTRLR